MLNLAFCDLCDGMALVYVCMSFLGSDAEYSEALMPTPEARLGWEVGAVVALFAMLEALLSGAAMHETRRLDLKYDDHLGVHYHLTSTPYSPP